MTRTIATARAGSNIALIKYWGKSDASLNLPLNDSISMTLSDATTTTTVEWMEGLDQDELYIDGERILDHRASRVSRHLDRLRAVWYRSHARINSSSTFPAGTGIASSASAFCALTTAAIAAFGEGSPDDTELTRWCRLGSGSACRSVHGGFVHWHAGDDSSSTAQQIATESHWDLRDLVVLVSSRPKEISSTEGHAIAARHPFMPARQEHLAQRTQTALDAIEAKDFASLAPLVEREALEVQGIMMSGEPSCLYPEGDTLTLLHAVRDWRRQGLPVAFTLDAGPNVHLLCPGHAMRDLRQAIDSLRGGWDLLENRAGEGVALLGEHLL